MAQYTLRPSSFDPSQVGQVYHVGLSDGTTSYGYVFQPDPKGGMIERSNVADKQALIQYASSNLIDRDLVYFPRVTQGDFSSGGLQTVLLDQTKYFDSDLEIRTPGILTLRPAWHREMMVPGFGTPPVYQCVSYRGNIYSVFGTGEFYDSFGTGRTTSPGITCKLIDTDGENLFISDGGNYLIYWTGTGFATVSSSLGPVQQMWYIDLGTNGRFMYFTPDGTVLNRWDFNLNATVLVPTGHVFFGIVDICTYQTGIAIATRGSIPPSASAQIPSGYSDIWYHDGENMTRIVTFDGYDIVGICSCLGTLYATLSSTGNFEAPILVRIDSGQMTIAVRPSSPLSFEGNAGICAPVASGQYVYFGLWNPQIKSVSPANYIGVYDHITESYSHLPVSTQLDDNPQTLQPRQLACSGRAVVFPMSDSFGNAIVQAQSNSSILPSAATYQTTGTLVSSKVDFGTPSVPKRFRRIEIDHAPLNAGESITINAYVDQDPLAYHPGLSPVPATAGATNSVVGSSTTTLSFGTATVGKTLYYALTLNGPGTTTPQVQYTAIEVGGTWTWEFVFDCSSKRRLLNGTFEDPQGATGKDLYYLFRNAYENGTILTLYLAESETYQVNIESVDVFSPAYTAHRDVPVKADEEWTVHVILNQVA